MKSPIHPNLIILMKTAYPHVGPMGEIF